MLARRLQPVPSVLEQSHSVVVSTMEATMKVEAAVAVEVVEMMEPHEPRPAAIKRLRSNTVAVAVAVPVGVVRARCFSARRERSQQDY